LSKSFFTDSLLLVQLISEEEQRPSIKSNWGILPVKHLQEKYKHKSVRAYIETDKK